MKAGFQISDNQLLTRSLQGDSDAFAEIYRRQHRAVFHFATHMTGSSVMAEEVTQEVFMHLMRNSRQYDPGRGTLQAYLLGIARNFVLRTLQRERAYVGMVADEDQEESSRIREVLAGAPDEIINNLVRTETIQKVRQTVLALPAHYREVTVLCDLQELSYNEAAAVLGLAAGTVRSRLHRARAMLLERLLPLREAAASKLGQD
jgi:RNA polymerase sigma-70 factor (ECF subfamily)